jgi:hypothetical protein
MTTVDFITALFYEVDEQLHAIPKHPEAHLWPSEAACPCSLALRRLHSEGWRPSSGWAGDGSSLVSVARSRSGAISPPRDEPRRLATLGNTRALSALDGAGASSSAHGGRATRMEPLSDYAQLQLHFVDSVQRRYEVIRPIVLLRDRTVAQRAEEMRSVSPVLVPHTVDLFPHWGNRNYGEIC